jgi:uncharacterized membrane protein
MAAVALAFGASVAYGLSNFIGPLQVRRHGTGVVLIVSQVVALAVTAVVLALSGEGLPARGAVAAGLLAGLGDAAFLIAFYEAVAAGGPLSIIGPVTSAGVVIPVVYGVARGDELTAVAAVGIACAVVGCMLAARRGAGPAAAADPGRAWVPWTIAAALGTGLFLIALPHAARDGRWWALIDARIVVVLGVAGWILVRTKASPPPLRSLPALAVPGLLLLAGTILYTLAADRGLLAIVSVISSLYPVTTVALAYLLLRERLDGLQAGGVLLTFAGVAMVVA